MAREVIDEVNPLEDLQDLVHSELEQIRSQINEIGLMLTQSQVEVNRLAQRNATYNSQLQQIKSNLETMPRNDIRQVYDTVIDGQQRLFTMRGQLEKLQSDREHLERYAKVLEQISTNLVGLSSGSPDKKSLAASSQTLEVVIRAQEAERQRLSRQMHDGPAQALSNFILQMEIAVRLFDLDQAKAREELQNLKNSASSTFQKVRDFIFELRPMMLDDLGLVPTLNRYLENMKSQTSMDIRFTPSGGDVRLESYREVMIFRAVQELLGNAIRHGQGTQVKIQLDTTPFEVRLVVDDNGKGFDVNSLAESTGTGLKVIQDRVKMLGGEIDIDSVPGQGARISFTIPAQLLTN
jgi:two-component system sensor histidine kinase DegS